jgi:hypothetical protein
VAQIDEQLEQVNRELRSYEELLAERDRLVSARRALLGEETPRITQDDVADYLREHPGSRAKQIADHFGVALTSVSAHLYRGKTTRFVSRPDGWHLRPEKQK